MLRHKLLGLSLFSVPHRTYSSDSNGCAVSLEHIDSHGSRCLMILKSIMFTPANLE
jgi:hypothetical protein